MCEDGENVGSHLALVIKHFRSIKGLTQAQLGESVFISGSLVGMIETGRRTPKPDIARRLDELFGTDTLISDLATETRKGHQPEWLRPWTEVEGEAEALRGYEPNLIPGLLQTEAYARAVLMSGLLTPEQAEEHVTIRMDRQAAVLDRKDPPVSTFAIEQSALTRGDPAILKEQLLHLVEVGRRPRTFIHVVPAEAGFHPGQNGPFVLASLDDGEVVGFVDDQLEGRLIIDVNRVAALERVWQAICAVALPCDLSRDLILRLVKEL